MFKKDENGAIVVEATLSLTTFLFLFFMVFSIITSARCQAIIGSAINNTAKEISQYSYLYGLTGINDSLNETLQTDADTQINTVIGNVNDMYNNFSSVVQTVKSEATEVKTTGLDVDSVTSKWKSLSDQLKTVADNTSASANSIKKQIGDIISNPKEFIFGIGKLLANGVLDTAKSRLIAEPVSRVLVKKHLLVNEDDDINYRLGKLGVMKGKYLGETSYFNGLDFSRSLLFPNNSDTIDIIVNYKIQMIQLLKVDIQFELTQEARTKAWFKGDGSKLKSDGSVAKAETAAEKAAGSAIWTDMTPKDRNALVTTSLRSDSTLKNCGTVCGTGSDQVKPDFYDPTSNTFILQRTTNPLYGCNSLDDIDKDTIKNNVESWATIITSTTDTLSSVTVRTQNGYNESQKNTYRVSSPNKKVVVVIPQEEGLKELYEQIIKECNTRGVTFEVITYGGKALG